MRKIWLLCVGLLSLGAGIAACESYSAPGEATTPDGGEGPGDSAAEATAPDAGPDGSPPLGPEVFTTLAANSGNTCAVREGKVFCWGEDDREGQLAVPFDGGYVPRSTSGTPFPTQAPVQSVTIGPIVSCAIAGGDAYCWGYNSARQRGFETPGGPARTKVPGLPAGKVLELAVGQWHVCGRVAPNGNDPTMYCWGYDGLAQRGPYLGDPGAPTGVANLPPVERIAAGGDSTCAITHGEARELWCWGATDWLQTGLAANATTPFGCSERANSCIPRKIILPDEPTAITMGFGHVCAATSTGKVYCWGKNVNQELGREKLDAACPLDSGISSPNDCSPTPILVEGVTGVKSMRSSHHHTCAHHYDGTVTCWGYAEYGQIGVADNAIRKGKPIDPATFHTPIHNPFVVDEIAVGGFHTCARKKDQIYCWGQPIFDANGEETRVNFPTLVNW